MANWWDFLNPLKGAAQGVPPPATQPNPPAGSGVDMAKLNQDTLDAQAKAKAAKKKKKTSLSDMMDDDASQ